MDVGPVTSAAREGEAPATQEASTTGPKDPLACSSSGSSSSDPDQAIVREAIVTKKQETPVVTDFDECSTTGKIRVSPRPATSTDHDTLIEEALVTTQVDANFTSCHDVHSTDKTSTWVYPNIGTDPDQPIQETLITGNKASAPQSDDQQTTGNNSLSVPPETVIKSEVLSSEPDLQIHNTETASHKSSSQVTLNKQGDSLPTKSSSKITSRKPGEKLSILVLKLAAQRGNNTKSEQPVLSEEKTLTQPGTTSSSAAISEVADSDIKKETGSISPVPTAQVSTISTERAINHADGVRTLGLQPGNNKSLIYTMLPWKSTAEMPAGNAKKTLRMNISGSGGKKLSLEQMSGNTGQETLFKSVLNPTARPLVTPVPPVLSSKLLQASGTTLASAKRITTLQSNVVEKLLTHLGKNNSSLLKPKPMPVKKIILKSCKQQQPEPRTSSKSKIILHKNSSINEAAVEIPVTVKTYKAPKETVSLKTGPNDPTSAVSFPKIRLLNKIGQAPVSSAPVTTTQSTFPITCTSAKESANRRSEASVTATTVTLLPGRYIPAAFQTTLHTPNKLIALPTTMVLKAAPGASVSGTTLPLQSASAATPTVNQNVLLFKSDTSNRASPQQLPVQTKSTKIIWVPSTKSSTSTPSTPTSIFTNIIPSSDPLSSQLKSMATLKSLLTNFKTATSTLPTVTATEKSHTPNPTSVSTSVSIGQSMWNLATPLLTNSSETPAVSQIKLISSTQPAPVTSLAGLPIPKVGKSKNVTYVTLAPNVVLSLPCYTTQGSNVNLTTQTVVPVQTSKINQKTQKLPPPMTYLTVPARNAPGNKQNHIFLLPRSTSTQSMPRLSFPAATHLQVSPLRMTTSVQNTGVSLLKVAPVRNKPTPTNVQSVGGPAIFLASNSNKNDLVSFNNKPASSEVWLVNNKVESVSTKVESVSNRVELVRNKAQSVSNKILPVKAQLGLHGDQGKVTSLQRQISQDISMEHKNGVYTATLRTGQGPVTVQVIAPDLEEDEESPSTRSNHITKPLDQKAKAVRQSLPNLKPASKVSTQQSNLAEIPWGYKQLQPTDGSGRPISLKTGIDLNPGQSVHVEPVSESNSATPEIILMSSPPPSGPLIVSNKLQYSKNSTQELDGKESIVSSTPTPAADNSTAEDNDYPGIKIESVFSLSWKGNVEAVSNPPPEDVMICSPIFDDIWYPQTFTKEKSDQLKVAVKPSFVVLERLNKIDTSVTDPVMVASRCSKHCRKRTLDYLCNLNLLTCVNHPDLSAFPRAKKRKITAQPKTLVRNEQKEDREKYIVTTEEQTLKSTDGEMGTRTITAGHEYSDRNEDLQGKEKGVEISNFTSLKCHQAEEVKDGPEEKQLDLPEKLATLSGEKLGLTNLQPTQSDTIQSDIEKAEDKPPVNSGILLDASFQANLLRLKQQVDRRRMEMSLKKSSMVQKKNRLLPLQKQAVGHAVRSMSSCPKLARLSKLTKRNTNFQRNAKLKNSANKNNSSLKQPIVKKRSRAKARETKSILPSKKPTSASPKKVTLSHPELNPAVKEISTESQPETKKTITLPEEKVKAALQSLQSYLTATGRKLTQGNKQYFLLKVDHQHVLVKIPVSSKPITLATPHAISITASSNPPLLSTAPSSPSESPRERAPLADANSSVAPAVTKTPNTCTIPSSISVIKPIFNIPTFLNIPKTPILPKPSSVAKAYLAPPGIVSASTRPALVDQLKTRTSRMHCTMVSLLKPQVSAQAKPETNSNSLPVTLTNSNNPSNLETLSQCSSSGSANQNSPLLSSNNLPCKPLLPEHKENSLGVFTKEKSAKRLKLEAKYPLPPGVVIKSEPDDSDNYACESTQETFPLELTKELSRNEIFSDENMEDMDEPPPLMDESMAESEEADVGDPKEDSPPVLLPMFSSFSSSPSVSYKSAEQNLELPNLDELLDASPQRLPSRKRSLLTPERHSSRTRSLLTPERHSSSVISLPESEDTLSCDSDPETSEQSLGTLVLTSSSSTSVPFSSSSTSVPGKSSRSLLPSRGSSPSVPVSSTSILIPDISSSTSELARVSSTPVPARVSSTSVPASSLKTLTHTGSPSTSMPVSSVLSKNVKIQHLRELLKKKELEIENIKKIQSQTPHFDLNRY